MDWVRQNHTVIPWALLATDLSVRIGARLYKTYNGYYQDIAVINSPTQSLTPKVSDKEATEVPYPPDVFPGARDVASPYGSLRVYEWGPEDGRKVLMIHGITNPCVALGGIAESLVDRGCRVILFDLPGRGYSTTPTPTPQSARFFTTCILLAIISSPISWTGNTRFALVGYSLGGGIAANFTSYFPHMISSLTLLAPAGLIRTSNIQFTNKLLYNWGALHEALVENVITKRLNSGAPPVQPKKTLENTPLSSEVPQKPTEPPLPLSKRYPHIAIAKVVPWQLQTNLGFVPSYISSMRYGPISNQHSHWARIGQRLDAQKLNADIDNSNETKVDEGKGLQNGKVLIICGSKDAIIITKELREDAAGCLGEGNFELREVDAGHDLPVTRSGEIGEIVWGFWQG